MMRRHPEDFDAILADLTTPLLTGDDTPAPAPAFGRRLWEKLMETQPDRLALPIISGSPDGRTSRPLVPAIVRRRRAGRRAWFGAGLTVAAGLVLVIVAGVVAGRLAGEGADDGDEDAPLAALSSLLAVNAPHIVDPKECLAVEPRTFDEIFALLDAATPEAGRESEQSADKVATPESPIAVSPETVIGVYETMRLHTGCLNAGDFLRVWALFSDRLLREGLSGSPYTWEPDQSETPVARRAEEWMPMPEIRQVWELEDGRVGAVLVFDEPLAESMTVGVFFVIFIEGNGRWLIDELNPLGPAGVASPVATPSLHGTGR